MTSVFADLYFNGFVCELVFDFHKNFFSDRLTFSRLELYLFVWVLLGDVLECFKRQIQDGAKEKARVVTRTARVNVENAGVSVSGEYERSQELDGGDHRLPNFIRAVDDECFLSRRSAVDVLVRSGRVQDYLNNPQKMTELFIEAMRSIQGKMEIDGIRYQRLDGEEYYLQEIFDSDELTAYLDKNAIAVDTGIYDHVIYDSTTVERPFAVAPDDDPDVKMFFKIPDKFKIETPIGTYKEVTADEHFQNILQGCAGK